MDGDTCSVQKNLFTHLSLQRLHARTNYVKRVGG